MLAGFGDSEQWTQEVHRLNSKLKEAERVMKESAKSEKKAKEGRGGRGTDGR